MNVIGQTGHYKMGGVSSSDIFSCNLFFDHFIHFIQSKSLRPCSESMDSYNKIKILTNLPDRPLWNALIATTMIGTNVPTSSAPTGIAKQHGYLLFLLDI